LLQGRQRKRGWTSPRRAEPACQRCRPRRPDPVAGLQGIEGVDRVRRVPRRHDAAAEELNNRRWHPRPYCAKIV
jgi:hypothetical protein